MGKARSMGLVVLLVTVATTGCGDDRGVASDATEPVPANDTTTDSTDGGEEPAATTMAGAETSTTIPDDAAPIDFCVLLENLDLSALLGEEPGEMHDTGMRCVVGAAADDSTGQLEVGLLHEGTAAFADQREQLGVDSELDGLGDEAFITGAWIHVRHGSMYIDFRIVGESSNDAPRPTDDDLIAAMRTILTNVGLDA